jgi:hypothetical protein
VTQGLQRKSWKASRGTQELTHTDAPRVRIALWAFLSRVDGNLAF